MSGERGVRWFLLLLSAIFITWAVIGWAAVGVYYYFCHTCPVVRGAVAEQWVKERMAYHGVHTVFEDWEGNHWFLRNGRKVRL